jgi:hypothetical protein
MFCMSRSENHLDRMFLNRLTDGVIPKHCDSVDLDQFRELDVDSVQPTKKVMNACPPTPRTEPKKIRIKEGPAIR